MRSRSSRFGGTPSRAQVAAALPRVPSLAEEGPDGINLGQRGTHRKFGEGVVTRFEGHGNHARVRVQFNEHGPKWLIVAYAKLTA